MLNPSLIRPEPTTMVSSLFINALLGSTQLSPYSNTWSPKVCIKCIFVSGSKPLHLYTTNQELYDLFGTP